MTDSLGDFAGKTAVLTGAASGMGAATAFELASRGATLALVDIDGDGLAETAAVCRDSGATVDTAVGDVSDPEFCTATVDAAASLQGSVDVLVTAAGTIHRADALGTSDADWHRVLRVNVDGVFYMCRAALHHMVPAKAGAIVNFGSVWGELGSANVAAYCASKGAVHQLTRCLALDHSRDGIRVNAVAPGEVDTPMLRSHRDPPLSDEEVRAIGQTIPIGRLADPREVAKVVAFLASDAASYVTGEIVHVDGGYAAR